jgi:CTP synthase (UTP-ammonia lyase)
MVERGAVPPAQTLDSTQAAPVSVRYRGVAVFEIAVLIDLPEAQSYFAATLAALEHAAASSSVDMRPLVIPTDTLEARSIARVAAVVVGPGSPYREPDAVYAAIRTAREQGIPLVGT